MYYVYILWTAAESKFYIGYSADLKRRISEHKAGEVHTTVRFKNPELIFYEAFSSKKDALRRERYFKTSKGKKTLKLMLHDSLKLTGSVTVALETLDLAV